MKKEFAMFFDLEDLKTLEHVLKRFPGDGTHWTHKAAELQRTVELKLLSLSHCDSPKKNTRVF